MKPHIIKFLPITLFIGLFLTTIWLHYYINSHQRYLFSTQARLDANTTTITAPMSGKITIFYIDNDRYVKKGETIFKFDSTFYDQQLQKTERDFTLIKNQVSTRQKAIITAEKRTEDLQSQLSEMSKKAFLASNTGEGGGVVFKDDITTTKTQLDETFYQLEQARQNFGPPGEATSKLKAAEALYNRAKINLKLSYVLAPQNGYVTHLTIRPGDKVVTNQKLFELVDNTDWWVLAKFRPFALRRIYPQQTAIIQLGQKPNLLLLKGQVEQISAGIVRIKILNPESRLLLHTKELPLVILDTASGVKQEKISKILSKFQSFPL